MIRSMTFDSENHPRKLKSKFENFQGSQGSLGIHFPDIWSLRRDNLWRNYTFSRNLAIWGLKFGNCPPNFQFWNPQVSAGFVYGFPTSSFIWNWIVQIVEMPEHRLVAFAPSSPQQVRSDVESYGISVTDTTKVLKFVTQIDTKSHGIKLPVH